MRDTVFISYSRRDMWWLRRLQVHLDPLVRQGAVRLWDDTMIQAGAAWQEEIVRALDSAHVAVLLVSPDFLASDFIARNVLPPLLRAAQEEGVILLWVPVTASLYEGTEIAGYQATHPPDRPLRGLRGAARDAALVEVAKQVLTAASNVLSPTRAGEFRNVPAPNLFFIGRQGALEEVRRDLERTGRAAISGLGGIGKTETAIEYAYRNSANYRAILWVRAESEETLQASVGEIARALDLPERNAQEPERVVAGLRRWLEESADWLLILDNADDLGYAGQVAPARGKGHVLFTTRARMMGGAASRISLAKMESEEAALLLLRRAEILADNAPFESASATNRSEATALSEVLGGLPLALAQAGAYIAAANCGVAGYRRLYTEAGDRLRARRGKSALHPHETVTRTFSLAFDRITRSDHPGVPDDPETEAAKHAAADLLRLCAFLAPDAIPEEILIEDASVLGEPLKQAAADPLLYEAMMEQACCYSLLEREPATRTLSLHRIVQEVLKDGMEDAVRRVWMERAVRAVNCAFPHVDFSRWSECDRFLPHALVCVQALREKGLEFDKAVRLLNQAGTYLCERGHYKQSESLFQQSLEMSKRILGDEHPDTLRSQNNLAFLYDSQGRYAEAEPLYQLTWETRRRILGADHPNTLSIQSNLAALYDSQGRYDEAESLLRSTWETSKRILGPEHPDTLTSQNNLAYLYESQDRYDEAEPLYESAWEICKRVFGPEHPDTLVSQNNLAMLYNNQGRYIEAEPLYRATWESRKRVLGTEHPDTLTSQSNLAYLYESQGRTSEAEPLYQLTWEARKRVLGPEHPDTLRSQNNLAFLYSSQERYHEAETLQKEVAVLAEKVLGASHPRMATYLGNHAIMLRALGREEEARVREERAAAIQEAHARQQNAIRPGTDITPAA